MSELLDKTAEQQSLVVREQPLTTESVETDPDETAQATEPAGTSATGVGGSDTNGEHADKAHSTAESSDDAGLPDPSFSDATLTNNYTATASRRGGFNFVETLKSASKKWKDESKQRGVLRHRLVTGACTLLSLTVLSVFTFDAKNAFTRPAILDRNYNLSYNVPSEEELRISPNLHVQNHTKFVEGRRPVYSTENGCLYGYLDEKNQVAIKPKWAEATDFSEGFAAVKDYLKQGKSDGEDEAVWSYIDKSGKVTIKGPFHFASAFHDGAAAVMTRDDKAALIDKNGKFIIKTKASEPPERIGEFWKFTFHGVHGLMNSKGEWVLKPVYSQIRMLDNSSRSNVPQTAITMTEGRTTGYIQVWQDDRCGVLDSTGKFVVPLKYADISSFNNGVAGYFDGETYKHGLIDQKGKIILEPKYDFVTAYDDVIAARDNKVWHLFDSKGNVIKTKIDGPLSNDNVPWFQDGLAPFVSGEKCGYLDTTGNIKIPAKFEFAMPFRNGFATVFDNGVWRIIDKNGNFTSGVEFAELDRIDGDNMSVSVAGNLYRAAEVRSLDAAKKSFKDLRGDYKRGFRGQ